MLSYSPGANELKSRSLVYGGNDRVYVRSLETNGDLVPGDHMQIGIRNQESGIIYSRKFTVHAIDNRMHTVFIVHIDMGCW